MVLSRHHPVEDICVLCKKTPPMNVTLYTQYEHSGRPVKHVWFCIECCDERGLDKSGAVHIDWRLE